MARDDSMVFSSSEEVLVAAYALYEEGKKQFTEWELTVKTWELNKDRWGLKGFEHKYPDHKRVMNEIMAKGTQKVLGRGWLIRVKPNYYTITNGGKAKAIALSSFSVTPEKRNVAQYDAVTEYITDPVFKKYLQNPQEPKTWLEVSAFLSLTKNDPDMLERNIKQILTNTQESLDWMKKNNLGVLKRSDSVPEITRDQLLKLEEFIKVLEQRFKDRFDAIRTKK